MVLAHFFLENIIINTYGTYSPHFSTMTQERYMRFESARLKSFPAPYFGPFDASVLARTGMFLIMTADRRPALTCYFCNITVDKWLPTSDEVLLHKAESPRCPLMLNWSTTNVPINQHMLTRELALIPPQPESVKLEIKAGQPTTPYYANEYFLAYAPIVDRKYSFR